MATEESRLLKKSFDYLSTAAITVNPKSLECIVVVPTVHTFTSNNCEDVDHFDGLTLEELCSYLDDPWWKLLRRGIFISFWIVFVAIFASACIISIVEYEQQCTINSMKSALYHVVSGGGDDDGAIVRNNTLSTSSTASNTTALQ